MRATVSVGAIVAPGSVGAAVGETVGSRVFVVGELSERNADGEGVGEGVGDIVGPGVRAGVGLAVDPGVAKALQAPVLVV